MTDHKPTLRNPEVEAWLRDAARHESPDYPASTIPGRIVERLPDYEAAVTALGRLELAIQTVVDREPHHYYEEWGAMRRELSEARTVLRHLHGEVSDRRVEEIRSRWNQGIIHSDCHTCHEKADHARDDVRYLLSLLGAQ